MEIPGRVSAEIDSVGLAVSRRGYDTFPIAHPRASPQSARDHRAMRRLPGVTPPMRLKARMNAASDS